MPRTEVNGLSINYEVLGSSGPWVSITGGGRSDMNSPRPLAELIAAGGYRVVIHDRSNCGASDVSFTAESEQIAWADELYQLLRQLDALPAFVGGGSAGCRLSFLLALRHPEAVRGLFVWRPSGGEFACEHLAEEYHDEYLAAARQGGMQAVCETEFFRERIAANPANRERLLETGAQPFH
jgi:pimeloyl-ACP methyl ester carboxylesterase